MDGTRKKKPATSSFRDAFVALAANRRSIIRPQWANEALIYDLHTFGQFWREERRQEIT